MGKGYSVDMRKAAVTSVENGKVQSKVADYFGISRKTLSNWLRKSRQTGDLSPAIKSSYKSRKIDRSMLQVQIQREPDSTLSELANQFNTSISNIDYHLRKMKITRKKKPCSMPSEVKKNGQVFKPNSTSWNLRL
jgi:transposase